MDQQNKLKTILAWQFNNSDNFSQESGEDGSFQEPSLYMVLEFARFDSLSKGFKSDPESLNLN